MTTPTATPSTFARICARLRVPLTLAGVVLILVDIAVAGTWFGTVGAVLIVAGLALYFRVGTARGEPIPVHPPVAGRWEAINSPGTRVPSHGLHAWGQTYAVDLVRVPDGSADAGIGSRPDGTAPEEFPSFGEPVLAMGDGTIVRVRDAARDQVSRGGTLGMLRFFATAPARELRGPAGLLGNWITIDLGEGRYALVAHLRRGSARVRVGDRVVAGQQIAECGNTGNTTEPHVHAQVMDSRHPMIAAGLPMRFTGVDGDGALPADGGTVTSLAAP